MKVANFFSMASSFSSMQRYSQTFLNKKESVLEHTGFVVLFCCLIAQELIARGREVDVGVLLSKAALHDVDEIITGDIPRPTKYFDEEARKTFERIEQHGMKTLIEKMELQQATYELWKNSKADYEGAIVAIADVVAVAFKAWEETHLLGNKGFSSHAECVIGHFDRMLLSLDDEYLRSVVTEAAELTRSISWK